MNTPAYDACQIPLNPDVVATVQNTPASAVPPRCEHPSFFTNATIAKLTERDGGPIVGYSVDINIHCEACGLPFRFLGLPFGSSPFEPRLSADSQELRAPIEPAYVTEILGSPVGEIGHG